MENNAVIFHKVYERILKSSCNSLCLVVIVVFIGVIVVLTRVSSDTSITRWCCSTKATIYYNFSQFSTYNPHILYVKVVALNI